MGHNYETLLNLICSQLHFLAIFALACRAYTSFSLRANMASCWYGEISNWLTTTPDLFFFFLTKLR